METKLETIQFSNMVRASRTLEKEVGASQIWRAVEGEYIFLFQLIRWSSNCFGDITHIAITKNSPMQEIMNGSIGTTDGYEPTYSEKVIITQKLIMSNSTVAMEIFPKQANVVDKVDMYHIWVCEKREFPFGILETTEIPDGKEWESETVAGLEIEYIVRTTKTKFGKVAYFYIRRKDGKELRWVEKQQIKNELQHEDLTAIEIISAEGIGKPTCLMYLPEGYYLDFGLHRK